MRQLLGVLVILISLGVCAQSVTIAPSKYTTLYENLQNSNSSGDFLFSGKTIQSKNSLRRALLQFDLSSVPEGAVIEKVSLTLKMNKTILGPINFGLHRVVSDWGVGNSDALGEEGTGTTAMLDDATWECAYSDGVGACKTTWVNAGGDFVPEAMASDTVHGVGFDTWSSTQFLNVVKSWIENPDSNFGMILIGDEVNPSAKRFDAKGVAAPSLLIEYSLPCGMAVNQSGIACEVNPVMTNPEVAKRFGFVAGSNPASNHLNVSIDGVFLLKMIDLKGKEVIYTRIDHSIVLDLSSITSGVYNLVLSNEETQLMTQIIVE